jgi:hypothetical protein
MIGQLQSNAWVQAAGSPTFENRKGWGTHIFVTTERIKGGPPAEAKTVGGNIVPNLGMLRGIIYTLNS